MSDKRAWGTALHGLLNGQRIAAHDRAALRMVADDIEQDGLAGPLMTELAYRAAHDPDPPTRDYCNRLKGSVKKYRDTF